MHRLKEIITEFSSHKEKAQGKMDFLGLKQVNESQKIEIGNKIKDIKQDLHQGLQKDVHTQKIQE